MSDAQIFCLVSVVIATEQDRNSRANGGDHSEGAKLLSTMQRLLFIGLAGFVGTLLRYWLSGWTAQRFGETFPTGTLVVNLVGCFLAGLLFYLMFDRYLVNQTIRTVL